MKKATVLLTLCLLALFGWWARGVRAQSPESAAAIQLANDLYQRGDYDSAEQLYQQQLDSGNVRSALYYNLGNAHYQQGELGAAIASYRRALLLNPRNADAQANLALARAARQDQLPDVHDWMTTFADWHSRWTTNTVATVALASWVLVGAAALLRRGVPEQRRWLNWVAVPLLALLLVSGFALGQRVTAHEQAVVIVPSVAVQGLPTESSVTQFELHDGAEVDLLEQRNGWVKIGLLGDESQGWLPATAVESLES